MTHSTLTRRRARLYSVLTLVLVAVAAWLRGDNVTDDRGSDSSEKALMIILAISIGGAVSAAAIAYVATKTALFK
jgi:uncharacterized membrane protein YwzB